MLDLTQFAKEANLRDPGPALNNALQSDARKNLLYMLVGGAGMGAAARGGMGLLNLGRRNMARPKPAPVATLPADDEEEHLKMAAWPTFDWSGWAEGDQARSLMEVPWFPPAAMAAGLGGAYGGWKVLDKVMDGRRQSEQDQELETAKQRFQQAIQGSGGAKFAEDNELGSELDALFDEVKTAMDDPDKIVSMYKTANGIPGGRTAGRLAGLYGIYALLAGGAAGTWAYNRAKKKTGPEVLDAAMKRRKKMRSLAKPPAVYASVPVPSAKPETGDEEEEVKLPSPSTQESGLLGFDSPPSRAITRQY